MTHTSPLLCRRTLASCNVLAFLILTVAGCGTERDIVACSSSVPCATGSTCVSGGCVPNDAAVPNDANTTDLGNGGDAGPDQGDDGGLVGFCAGAGPLLIPSAGAAGDRCTGQLAESAFRFAVCSCGEFVVSNTFRTDSFDSRNGVYDSASAGTAAAFGTNGSVNLAATATIGGSAWVAGAQGLGANASAPLSVAGNLRVAGPVASMSTVTVDLDADINGDLSATSVTIDGSLMQPGGASITAPTQAINAQASGVVTVTPPCDCGSSAAVDPAALVGTFASLNDNAEADFDPSVLANHTAGAVVDLPCGRLYAPSIGGTGALTLRVAGRTALFVGGDLAPDAAFSVTIVGDGELDLFVAGNLVSASSVSLGSAATPSRVRLYVGGSDPIALSGGGTFAGFVYAPSARFTMSAAIEIFGGLFANGIVASDSLTVHYDDAIRDAASDCTPPTGCDSCNDCGGNACIGGACGACVTDADCCAPLTCFEGVCSPAFE
ncbi:MAG: hypothetical protein IPI43_01585 [Sandaracinaceae bacterium]|jgi:hypothetical protein|nr:hypothetical protein [Sandaracinaceae bacterium]